MENDFHDKFILNDSEEIVAEYEISKRDMECFVAGALMTLLFVLIIWALRIYLTANLI